MRKRAGILLIATGLALAGLTAVLVMGIARQATAASHAQLRQVEVVVATRDIVDQAQVTADALEVKAFPADLAPAGAFSSVDDIVGKFAQGFIPKGQIIVGGQLLLAQPAPNLSDRITPGMVVVWLPMPDVVANTNALKPGDHVDVLLTAPMRVDAQTDSTGATTATSNGLSTQATLQNVAIYRIGDDELNVQPPTKSVDANANQPLGAAGGAAGASAPTAAHKAIGLLLDHQDAVTMKFVKDAGGTIDLVTRSNDDQQTVYTDGVTLDSLSDRFHFRIPQAIHAANSAKQ